MLDRAVEQKRAHELTRSVIVTFATFESRHCRRHHLFPIIRIARCIFVETESKNCSHHTSWLRPAICWLLRVSLDPCWFRFVWGRHNLRRNRKRKCNSCVVPMTIGPVSQPLSSVLRLVRVSFKPMTRDYHYSPSLPSLSFPLFVCSFVLNRQLSNSFCLCACVCVQAF